MYSDKDFELDIFLNKRLLRNFYNHKFSIIEERESQIEEKRERWLKEKIYRIKENILYNNLEGDYLSNLNLNLSNIFYFKHYLKFLTDFESIDFDLLQSMRTNYLKTFFKKEEKDIPLDQNSISTIQKHFTDNEVEISKKNEHLFFDFIKENLLTPKNDDVICMISSLIAVVLSPFSEDRVVLLLLDNILQTVSENEKNFNSNTSRIENYENSNEIEKNLGILFETLDKRIFLNFEKLEKKFVALVLHKLLTLSLKFRSSILFIHTIYKIREINLIFEDFKEMANAYFKKRLRNVISLSPTSEDVFRSFEYEHNNEINFMYKIVSDESFVYLIVTNDKKFLNILKIGTGFKNSLIGKVYSERLIPIDLEKSACDNDQMNNLKNILVVQKEKLNLLQILVITRKNEMKIFNVNKNNLELVENLKNDSYEKFCLDEELLEQVLFFNTNEDFLILCKNLNDNNFILLKLKQNFQSISLNRIYYEEMAFKKKYNHLQKLSYFSNSMSHFSFFNRYVYFLDNVFNDSNTIFAILNLNSGKVSLQNIKDLMKGDNYYFNKFNNYLLRTSLNKEKTKIKFDYMLNKVSSPFENLELIENSFVRRKIKMSKLILHSRDINEEKVNLVEVEQQKMKVESISKPGSNSKITNYLLKKLINSQYDYQTNELKFKFLETSRGEKAEAYFNLLISYYMINLLTFGNLKNSFKQHSELKNLQNVYTTIYNKELYNNLSAGYFDVLCEKTINYDLNREELLLSVVLIKSFLVNVIDLNVCIDEYLGKNLEKVFKKLFWTFCKKIEDTTERQILISELHSLLELIVKNSNLISQDKKFVTLLFEIVNVSSNKIKNISYENDKESDSPLTLEEDITQNTEVFLAPNYKILTLNLILSFYEKTRIDLNLVENIVKFELNFIQNEIDRANSSESVMLAVNNKSKTDDRILMYDFIHKFKKLFFKSFFNEILSWEITKENNLITQIFDLIIANLSILITNLRQILNFSKNTKLNEYLNNFSFLTHSCLFFINTIITKSEIASQTSSHFFEKFPYKYFEKIINLMIEFDKHSSKMEEKKFNNLKEKSYLFETEHPCENDTKRSILFKFDDIECEEINYKFDCMSSMNNDSKIILEYDKNISGPYNTNFPPESQTIQTKGDPKNILMKYSPNSLSKETNSDSKLSYGFLFKCQNYNSNENEIHILIEIRRSLINSICKLIFNTLIKSKKENVKGENKKEMNLYKALFSSKLLENISINKLKDLKHLYSGSFSDSHYKNLMGVVETISSDDEVKLKIKEKCLKLFNSSKISSISLANEFSQKSHVSNEISDIISNIVNNSDEYYKKGIHLLQKYFTQKNPWGSVSGREIEHVIVYLFTIILKHERLILKYKEYLESIHQEGGYENMNPVQIMDLPNFNFFLRVFSECSKLRVWFNERKMQIGEYISSKQNLGETLGSDMGIFSEATEKHIDLEITNYILKVTKKAEFLLEAMNSDPEEESSKRNDSSPRGKHKEYTMHVQDLINNLMIYIKTDEVEIEKIIEKIKVQNDKAINKETALICFNILLRIANNKQQDLRDILYWINIIFKQCHIDEAKDNSDIDFSSTFGYNSDQNSQNNLIYFNKDLYGSDTVFHLRVSEQFYNMINCLLDKVQINEEFSFSNSNREIITHLILAQSLIWKMRKRDYIFLRSSKFFEIFLKNSIFSSVLTEIDDSEKDDNTENEYDIISESKNHSQNIFKEEAIEEIQYGKECINFELLHSNLLQIMTVYSLQVFDKLNDEIVEVNKNNQSTSKPTQLISPRTATSLLSLMRKRSEVNEYESFKIINKITDVILLEFEEYLRTMNEISQGECNEKILKNIHKKEEKLNSFLILLYRCLSFNTRLISHLMKYSGDILSTFFQIFLYSSDKNKYVVIKFIKLMTVFNYEEEFFINSVNLIKKILDKKFHNFAKFINKSNLLSNSKKRKEWRFDAGSSTNFYLLFVIKLIIALLNSQTNENFEFFFTTQSDRPLAFELIAYLRELTLVKDDIFQSELKKMTAEIFTDENFNSANKSSNEKEKEILLLILGCEFNPLRVGAKIFINLSHLDTKKSLEKSLEEFSIEYCPDVSRKIENKKVGVILGFTESAKNPFIVDETITEFSLETFSYSPQSKYAMVVLEENLNRENIKNLSYDTMVVDTKNLELCSENLFEIKENEEIISSLNSNNVTGYETSSGKFKQLQECLSETKILENFFRDLLSVDLNNFDENFGNLYLTLKIIKNIIFSRNEQLISNLFFEQVLDKFDVGKVLEKFIELSLCSLNIKMTQSSLETLEKNMMYEILLIKEEETKMKRNRASSFNAEHFDNFTMISQSTKSIFVKFNKSLIKEISFLKLYNADKIISGCEYCPMIKKENLSEVKTRSILFINTEDLIKLKYSFDNISNENLKNIRGIITNEQIMYNSDAIDFENFKIPLVAISDIDFSSAFSFIFENIPNEEFEELFLQSIQRDFSSFIDIPPQFVDETVRFGQRDLLLKLLDEEPHDGYFSKGASSTTAYSASDFDQGDIKRFPQLFKLIALISRRILIRLITLRPKIKNHLDIYKVLKIIKLLIYENNIIEIENYNHSNNENEIVFIIKEFLSSLFSNKNKDEKETFDLKMVTSLMDISFLNKYNYIDQKLVIHVDTENDLLTFENIENNLKIIHSLIKSEKIKSYLLSCEETRHFIREYEMKLFHALIIKLDDFTMKNKDTGEFILHVLIILLQRISDFITEQKDDSIKANLKQYTFLFKSEEFLRIAKKAKSIFENKQDDIKVDTLDAKIINFFLIFLDLAFLCLARLDIDLNLNYFVTSKMMNLYYAYSLMTKKFKNFEFFVLFCQMKDFVDTKKYLDENIVRQNFYYKDTTNSTPHLMRYNYDSCEGVTVRVLSGNKDKDKTEFEFDKNSLVLLYSQKDCNSNMLQEYVDCQDVNKEILINNSSSNQFYISLPYNGNSHNLFCCGHNEYQSLGCNLEASKIYGTLCKAVGITSKIIKSFKFGYYHCFAVGTDDKISVCGKDYASGLKELKENATFTTANHFHDIAAKEGVANLWVNNYNSTIMLTRNNKLYGCGINTDCNLTNKMNIGNSTNIPYELPPFNPEIKSMVKLVACGFKTSMIIFDDGSALTVGCNSFHETGNLTNTNIVKEYFRLQPPEGCKIVNAVSGEHYFILLIQDRKNKMRLYSMGCNDNGRSGQDIDNSHKLQKCKGVENLEFKLIASRNASSAAITTSGLLYTFGSNESGSLGHGNNSDYLRPTLVEALRDYITDDVSISHNHMVVVARDRMKGEKHLFVSGSNQYGCLGFEDLNLKVKSPKELLFFPEKEAKSTPVRVATSRYQSYILAMENKIQDDKNNFGIECQYCNAYIKDVLYFRPIKNIQSENIQNSKENDNNETSEQNKMIIGDDSPNNSESNCEFICQMCIINKIGSEIIYMINTPSHNLKKMQFNQLIISKDILRIINESEFDTPMFLDNETFSEEINEYNINYFYKCCDCDKNINSKVYISSFDNGLTLCHSCITNHSNKIEFPQVFYVLNKIRIKESLKKNLPRIPDLSKLLWNIEKSEKPYLTLEIVPQISQLEEIRIIGRDKKTFELFSKWRQMNNDYLIELNQIKDEIDIRAKEESSKNIIKKNDLLTSVSDYGKLIQYLKTNTDSNSYKLIKSLDDEEFNILNELSSSINDCIFYLMNLTFKIKEKGILHQAITDNLALVSSKARLNIFHERLTKLKVAVNASEKELSINRMKAMRFYERKVVDSTGEYTIFGQMYQKMKKYPISNYLCKKENRLFFVNLTGEGATDYGGPYREVLSTACEELHSPHLDLFIKSPNSRNEVGALRDKYIVNPAARSAFYIDMYFFIGCLIGYAISSGHLLNLNIHPKIWKLILNGQVDFSQYETIDKLFYKYINDISTSSINSQKDFEMAYDQYFVIQLSDGSEYELIPNGKRIQLTFDNKESFVNLAKNARLNEFKIQIESIRSGLTNVIPDNILSLLTHNEIEELACGTPTLDIEILKQYTEYQNFRPDDIAVLNFWSVLESFTNEDKVLYLKYVWGRSRLPDPNIFPFVHVITKMWHASPDSRLPAATTCYFTLKLPEYSSIEILREKLKYVITNCSEIDADFAVTTTFDV